jgi:hypothetical protein
MLGAVPPLLQYVSMAWCLVKYRDNFTFCHTKNHCSASNCACFSFSVVHGSHAHDAVYFQESSASLFVSVLVAAACLSFAAM